MRHPVDGGRGKTLIKNIPILPKKPGTSAWVWLLMDLIRSVT